MSPLSLRSVLKAALAVGLTLWFQSADALPVSTGGVLAGNRGDPVTPTLFDASVTDFEAADVKLTFDPIFLTFVGSFEGSLLPAGSSVLAGSPTPAGLLLEVLISIASGVPVTGGPGSLFGTSFLINNSAPIGITSVLFETLDPGLYDFSAISAPITVLQPSTTPAPIGNTTMLLLAGLAGFLAFRLRLG